MRPLDAGTGAAARALTALLRATLSWRIASTMPPEYLGLFDSGSALRQELTQAGLNPRVDARLAPPRLDRLVAPDAGGLRRVLT